MTTINEDNNMIMKRFQEFPKKMKTQFWIFAVFLNPCSSLMLSLFTKEMKNMHFCLLKKEGSLICMDSKT